MSPGRPTPCRLPQDDPLNMPLEDLQEEVELDAVDAAAGRPSRRSTRFALSAGGGTPSACGAAADAVSGDSSALPSPVEFRKPRTSLDIMRSLPEKLRGHAEHAQALADDALCAFVIINAALQRSSALAEYVGRKDLKQRMGDSFRVGMGFGLHAGCAPVRVPA